MKEAAVGSRLLATVVALLIVVGVAAAVARAVFVADLGQRMEPVRERMMAALGLRDPLVEARRAEMVRFDSNYATHPRVVLAHVLPGALFLALTPLQFWGRFRTRFMGLHRWSGRLLLVAALASTVPALYFGIRMPFGGRAETVPIALAGSVFLFALTRAFLAIRARRVALHREWMIRAYAVALGIATIRVIGLPMDLVLTPLGVPLAVGFVATLWSGWIVTMSAAEVWIRHTRRPPDAARMPRATAA